MKKKAKNGFSLVEILIVILVVSILLPMMMMIVGGIAQQMTKSDQVTIATDYARELMELILLRRFDEEQPPSRTGPTTDWTPANCPPSPCLGHDGESRASFDDVDDFHNFSDTPVTGYDRTVEVVYVAPPDHSSISGTQTDYKRITVNVTHNAIGTVSLVTLVGGWGN